MWVETVVLGAVTMAYLLVLLNARLDWQVDLGRQAWTVTALYVVFKLIVPPLAGWLNRAFNWLMALL